MSKEQNAPPAKERFKVGAKKGGSRTVAAPAPAKTDKPEKAAPAAPIPQTEKGE